MNNMNSINNIPFKNSLKTFGLILNSNFTFKNLITNLIKTYNYHLHAISPIRAFLTDEMVSSLVRCFVLNCINYCNSALYVVANFQLKRLKSVVSKKTSNVKNHRLISSSKDNLQRLHWLPVEQRII